MARFRKKPVEIEAWLWDETKETFAALEKAGMKWTRYDSHVTENYVRNIGIETPEGTMRAEKGDWIIKGTKGEFYPCRPDIFAATYDEITSSHLTIRRLPWICGDCGEAVQNLRKYEGDALIGTCDECGAEWVS